MEFVEPDFPPSPNALPTAPKGELPLVLLAAAVVPAPVPVLVPVPVAVPVPLLVPLALALVAVALDADAAEEDLIVSQPGRVPRIGI